MTTAFFTVEPRHVQLALLAMTRLSGLLLLTPPVQAPMVPVQLRVGLAFSLLFLMWPQLAVAAPPLAGDVWSLGGLAASELFIGVAIGFAGRLVVAAASFAAELVSLQMGFGLASILDPLQGQHVTVLTRLFDWTVMLMFLALDGHHLMLGAVVESFRLVPTGGRLFGVGMALVAPALGVLFLANLALVLASRVVPQLNLMAVGFPILVALGLIMMSINLDLLGALMGGEIRNLESLLVTLLRSLGHGR